MDEIIDSISTCPATEENIEILQRLGVAVNIIIDDNGTLKRRTPYRYLLWWRKNGRCQN